jgi:hypothetical protein
VRRQVQHVKNIPHQRRSDLRQRRHLQDLHLGLRVPGHISDGIQHRLHFRLNIQRHIRRLRLIRRGDRSQDFQRPRQPRHRRQRLIRRRIILAAPGGPTVHADARHQAQRP